MIKNKYTRKWRTPLPSRAALKIPKKSSNHFVGQMTFGEGNGRAQCLGFSSMLEHRTALMLIYAPGIIDVEEQIAPVTYLGADGKDHPRWFDFRATRVGGARALCDVKCDARAELATYRDDMQRVAAAAVPGTAEKVFVVTERNIDPLRLKRVTQFHACRVPQPELDQKLGDFLADFSGDAVLRDLLAEANIGDDGFHAAVRLVREGVLFVPEDVPITLSCTVSKQGGDHA